MPTSPSIYNYSVLKATVTFEGTLLGNCTEIELTPDVTALDHVTSQEGVGTVDRTVITQKKLSLRIVMDEWSEHNVRLAVLGAASGTIELYSESEREGAITITGTNDIGQQYDWTLPSVSFLPTGSMNLISEEFQTMEVTGTVNLIAGVFGTVAASGGEVAPV